MNFNLDKDLVFFDIEATGTDVVKDRIVQIALIKYLKDGGEPIEKNLLINPRSGRWPRHGAGFLNAADDAMAASSDIYIYIYIERERKVERERDIKREGEKDR